MKWDQKPQKKQPREILEGLELARGLHDGRNKMCVQQKAHLRTARSREALLFAFTFGSRRDESPRFSHYEVNTTKQEVGGVADGVGRWGTQRDGLTRKKDTDGCWWATDDSERYLTLRGEKTQFSGIFCALTWHWPTLDGRKWRIRSRSFDFFDQNCMARRKVRFPHTSSLLVSTHSCKALLLALCLLILISYHESLADWWYHRRQVVTLMDILAQRGIAARHLFKRYQEGLTLAPAYGITEAWPAAATQKTQLSLLLDSVLLLGSAPHFIIHYRTVIGGSRTLRRLSQHAAQGRETRGLIVWPLANPIRGFVIRRQACTWMMRCYWLAGQLYPDAHILRHGSRSSKRTQRHRGQIDFLIFKRCCCGLG